MGRSFPLDFSIPARRLWPRSGPRRISTPGTPNSPCSGCNYYEPIVNINNGWIWRVRLDYLLGDNTKIYGSRTNRLLARSLRRATAPTSTGRPGNAIPYPGGGEAWRIPMARPLPATSCTTSIRQPPRTSWLRGPSAATRSLSRANRPRKEAPWAIQIVTARSFLLPRVRHLAL